MENPNRNLWYKLKEKGGRVVDWIFDHTKIVMPIILIVCVTGTVLIALNANQREQLEKEAEIAAANGLEAEAVESAEPAGLTVPDIPLEENAYPEINSFITSYYNALAKGDVDAVSAVDLYLDDIAKIRVTEIAKYIDYYDKVDVYSKIGLSEGSYVVYVYSEVKFKDVESLVPGFRIYYVSKDESGTLFINDGTFDEKVADYIKAVSLQDDVVDLNNKVTVEFNELLDSDEELKEFIAYISGKIDEDVGEILAKTEQPEIDEPEQGTDDVSSAEATPAEPAASKEYLARATDVVNIRSSDSETADKLDKAQVGQEFTILEQKGNGWSKVKYENGEAYIKSAYLEIISEETVLTPSTQEAAAESNVQSADAVTATGTVTVQETVRVRGSASTDGEILGTVYAGEKLDLVMKQADGWTKVAYKGKVGYVKSDYVE